MYTYLQKHGFFLEKYTSHTSEMTKKKLISSLQNISFHTTLKMFLTHCKSLLFIQVNQHVSSSSWTPLQPNSSL